MQYNDFCDKLFAISGGNYRNFPTIAEDLVKLGKINEAIYVMDLYKSNEINKQLLYITMGNFYNSFLKDYKSAIGYYEKYLEICSGNFSLYTVLADLYLKVYGEESREKQLFYWKLANKIKPNDRLVLHELAFCSKRLGRQDDCCKYYECLLKNNPLPEDYFNYGTFLISNGQFVKGSKYFIYRNFMNDAVFKNTLTPNIEYFENFKRNLSDKILLVHYEQGFGDTIMYCRFLLDLKNKVKKIIFVVQVELYELLRQNDVFNGIYIVPENCDISKLHYDLNIMLMDLPYLLYRDRDSEFTEMPYFDKYLTVQSRLIEEYKKKYINNDKYFKIGISYSGNKDANYSCRDVEPSFFFPLISKENIKVYSLQKNENQSFDGILPLGSTFYNFIDTACAIECMDLIISTDNVILNLAGALGVKTIGLFNKNPNFRWYKLTGENVGWYKSVLPKLVESSSNVNSLGIRVE